MRRTTSLLSMPSFGGGVGPASPASAAAEVVPPSSAGTMGAAQMPPPARVSAFLDAIDMGTVDTGYENWLDIENDHHHHRHQDLSYRHRRRISMEHDINKSSFEKTTTSSGGGGLVLTTKQPAPSPPPPTLPASRESLATIASTSSSSSSSSSSEVAEGCASGMKKSVSTASGLDLGVGIMKKSVSTASGLDNLLSGTMRRSTHSLTDLTNALAASVASKKIAPSSAVSSESPTAIIDLEGGKPASKPSETTSESSEGAKNKAEREGRSDDASPPAMKPRIEIEGRSAAAAKAATKTASRRTKNRATIAPPSSRCEVIVASSPTAATEPSSCSSHFELTSTVAAPLELPELQQPPIETDASFLLTSLPVDLLHISLSYLPPRDVRSLTATSATLRGTLLGGQDGRRLWISLATGGGAVAGGETSKTRPTGVCWPALANAMAAGKKYRLVDKSGAGSTTAATPVFARLGSSSEGNNDCLCQDKTRQKKLNLSVLLALSTQTTHPSGVDPSFLEKRQMLVSGINRRGVGGGRALGVNNDLFRQAGANGGQGAPQQLRTMRAAGPEYVSRAEFQSFDATYPNKKEQPPLRKNKDVATVPVIQFTGQVGRGDRCFRADNPLPGPSLIECPRKNGSTSGYWRRRFTRKSARKTLEAKMNARGGGGGGGGLDAIVEHIERQPAGNENHQGQGRRRLGVRRILRRPWHEANRAGSDKKKKKNDEALLPFVSPYVREERVIKKERIPVSVIDLTPRLVAYFEVSILPRPKPEQQQLHENLSGSDRFSASSSSSTSGGTGASDCVAVGLSTASFRHRSLMPGWDRRSYGYHSDDGGMFHGSGEMVRRYGPTYGEGDTVGCGIDYRASANKSAEEDEGDGNGGNDNGSNNGGGGAIFFTLNGEFLGYAWTNLRWGVTAPHASSTDLIDNASSPSSSNNAAAAARQRPPRLFPTVGVDTNCPVGCNFGERPFAFDLGEFASRKE